MFKAKEEIQEFVDTFCKINNIDSQIFEVSSISSATGGESKRLYNKTPIINKNCRFVIKYYCKYDLFIIWTNNNKNAMSYDLITIKDKLSKGIIFADKGTGNHSKNQELVYFDKSERLEQLLNFVVRKL